MTVAIASPVPPREAPISPLVNFLNDASHVSDRPSDEPPLCVDNIQGNSLAGFNKDHQRLVLLQIREPQAFKRWLSSIVPQIATVAEVLAFNRLFKALRYRRQAETGVLKATWLNIGFTSAGLRKIVDPAEIDDAQRGFQDSSFLAGLFARSQALNDPTDASVAGSPQNWLFGGSAQTEPDVVLMCASDDEDDLKAEVERLRASIEAHSGAGILYEQPGKTLPPPQTGHEHFGFLDGISQPGIRGKVSDDPKDLLTLRQNPNDASQGKPGQDCLYPGEFVFGYLRQDGNAADPASPTGPFSKARRAAAADWTDDGSFYVLRRLQQNVPAFQSWLEQTAAAEDLTADELGAALVGRHHGGAPVIATSSDDESLGNNDCRNNFFDYQTAPASGKAPADASQCDPGSPPQPDPDPRRCPFSAHIRKGYPRDDRSPTVPHLNESDTQTHRLLRRGIPFGQPYAGTSDDDGNRGLVFAAYQTSIVGQFEFVTTQWVNQADFKAPATGVDPIIGQVAGPNRARTVQIQFTNDDGRFHEPLISIPTDFVTPTGGAYFFTPSIDALWFLAGVAGQPSMCKGNHVPPQPPPPPNPAYP